MMSIIKLVVIVIVTSRLISAALPVRKEASEATKTPVLENIHKHKVHITICVLTSH